MSCRLFAASSVRRFGMLVAACALFLGGCAREEVEEIDTGAAPVADGPNTPTGGDHLSTSIRAGERTNTRLEGIQGVREEQKKEEEAFNSR